MGAVPQIYSFPQALQTKKAVNPGTIPPIRRPSKTIFSHPSLLNLPGKPPQPPPTPSHHHIHTMAQGAGQKVPKANAAKKATGGGHKQAHAKKPSSGIMKPQKKHNKTTADKLTKKYTGGMVAKTELMLGARAGHLEMIGKGRKKMLAEGIKAEKGGTRRFG